MTGITPGDFSVVICAYTLDRWDDIERAAASVAAQTMPPGETILVVDHNPDLLERSVASLAGIRVIANAEGKGLSGARNTGVAASTGRVVAFLDDDAAARPDWLEKLADAYEDEDVLGVGGTSSPAWDTARPSWFPEEFDWVVGCTYRGMPASRGPVRNMIGSNMSLRRSVLEVTGGFRADIGRIGARPVGCEETELCIRAVQRHPGGRFLHEPAATVAHRVPVARTTLRYFVRRCFAEGTSKAIVARLAGSGRGLATERRYVVRTLTAAVGRGLLDLLRVDPSGAARASVVFAGLAATALGYAIRRIHPGRATVQVSDGDAAGQPA